METKKETLPLTVGYLRLSADKQAGNIERQRQAIIALAAGRYDIRSFDVERGGSRSPNG